MGIVEKIQTWDDNWNDIIRHVIFQDVKLKTQMCVPPQTTINQFVEKYFIQDAATDQLLKDEKARVVYYDTPGYSTGNKNVRLKYKEFDIYVKDNLLFNATNDRIKNRCKLIAERINYQLRQKYHICNLHFDYEDEYDMWTKTVGYKRYHIVFSYKISV